MDRLKFMMGYSGGNCAQTIGLSRIQKFVSGGLSFLRHPNLIW